LLDSLLLGWDPYTAADGHADREAARAEMRLSRYDTDGDGVCDADACRNVRAVTRDLSAAVPEGAVDPWRAVSDAMTQDLAEIGIDLVVEPVTMDSFVTVAQDPRERIAMVLGLAFAGYELNASSFFVDEFHGSAMSDDVTNFSLVGATPERLAAWGYEVTEVPDVDTRIEACLPLTGSAQFECWAGLDQYLMLEVAPWVPLAARRNVSVVGPLVTSYSWDEMSHTPAFDRIAVGASPG
jgi:ABC-type transport system substrate-binding protein